MMTRNLIAEIDPLEMITIDQLVPQNHLVHKLESIIPIYAKFIS